MASPALKRILMGGLIGAPTQLPGCELWLDASERTSMAVDGSDRVSLWADKSGRSAAHCLVLNGTTGNNASTPDSAALSPTAGIDIDAEIRPATWSQDGVLVSSDDEVSDTQRRFTFRLTAAGLLRFVWWPDGATASQIAVNSSTAVPFIAFQKGFGRVRFNGNDGGAYTVTFYTSHDGENWTQLGTVTTGGATSSLFNSNQPYRWGVNIAGGSASLFLAANMFSSRVRALDGTVLCWLRFNLLSKMAASFTESSANAATVTINTSGATGARICGERDAYQGTVANQPVLTAAAMASLLTFDGSNDYMKVAPFGLSQPETVYFVGSQATWTSADGIFAGNTASTLLLAQTTSTPEISISAGSVTANNSGFAEATRSILTAIFNGAASSLRVKAGTPTTGDAGAGNAGGFVLGAKHDGSAPSNITVSEVIIFSRAHDAATQSRVLRYLARKWGITL